MPLVSSIIFMLLMLCYCNYYRSKLKPQLKHGTKNQDKFTFEKDHDCEKFPFSLNALRSNSKLCRET